MMVLGLLLGFDYELFFFVYFFWERGFKLGILDRFTTVLMHLNELDITVTGIEWCVQFSW